MPQLIAFAVAGTLAYAGYRWLASAHRRATASVRTKPEPHQPKDLGDLTWDEGAKVYRPRRD